MTYIHVNQNTIKANIKNKKLNPVISIKDGNKNIYCHEVDILGPSKLIYSNDRNEILSCGARVVIETNSSYMVIR